MRWRFTAAIVLVSAPAALAQPVLEPYRFEATFDAGSVGSWSSYPPAQDTAYDPTIWVKPLAGDPTASNRALYRELTPHYANDTELGVRKRLDLVVDASSQLRFRTYVRAANGTDGVRVRFAFADGTDWSSMVTVAETRRWVDAGIAFAELLSAGEKKHLVAVAFVAVCPSADTESIHRLGIDDVVITGFREQPWSFADAHVLDEWRDAISARHFVENAPVVIRARAPIPTPAASFELSRALTGREARSIEMHHEADGWSAEIASVPAGIWRATFSARASDGRTATSSLVFLVRRRDAPSGHPRLFLSAGDRARILAEAASGLKAEIWRSIQEEARQSRSEHAPGDIRYNFDAYDERFWLPTLGGYMATLTTAGHTIRTNAVVYTLSGDEDAGDAARDGLLNLAGWPSFVHPHILDQGQFTYWPVGLALIDLAVGFDMVYDRFTPDERDIVARALFDKGITEVAREYVEHNRVSSNTSNWISHVTGGGILSALATLGDIDDTELEPHLTGMILKLGELVEHTYDQDGSYGEGYSYANFTMQTLGEILPALERNFGIEFPPIIGRSHRFLLYQMDFDEPRIFDFGDTDDLGHTGPPTFTNFAYSLGKWRDPYLAWLYRRWPGRTDRDLFFADLSVESRPPEELPTSTIFRNVGTVVFREGFDADDFAFIFRCGPFYNHQHFDQGSFYLRDRGETLVTEVGRTHYYDDPQYQPLAIQAGGHSTILIDGDPESQRPGDFRHEFAAWRDRAEITDYLAWEDGGFASCDLGRLYKNKVRSLRRTVLWLAPRTLVLIDEVKGAPGSSAWNLRFHAPLKDDLTVAGHDAEITRPAATLRIQNIVPSSSEWEVYRRPLTLEEFRDEDPLTLETRGFAQLNAPMSESLIVNVLSTTGERTETTRDDDNLIVLTIEARRYVINRNPGSVFEDGPLSTDAAVYARDGERQWILRGSRTTTSDGAQITTTVPVSLLLDGQTMTYSSPSEAELILILANGERRTFRLAEGSGTIELDF